MSTKPYVVIAEDNKAYGKVYVNKLSAAGLEVRLVTRGDEALAVLRERCPDLLVLDLIMPGMDGFTLLEHIRSDKNPELQKLRVLVASNLSQDIDKEKVARYKVFGYFIKSDISISELIDRVRAALP